MSAHLYNIKMSLVMKGAALLALVGLVSASCGGDWHGI